MISFPHKLPLSILSYGCMPGEMAKVQVPL